MITAVTKDIMCTYICNCSLAPSFKSSKCCFLGPFTYTTMFSHTVILQIRYRTVCKISIPLSTTVNRVRGIASYFVTKLHNSTSITF